MYMGKKTGRRRWIAALSTIVVVAAAPAATDARNATEAAEGEPIRIGVSVSLSGDLAETGKLVERGYQFWAQTVNEQGGIQVGDTSHPVELVVQDDTSSPTTAATVAQQLITQENVDFMFGPYGTTNSLAVAQIAERNETVVIFPASSGDSLYEQGYQYIFGIIPKASTMPGFWLDAMLEADPDLETLGIISVDDVQPQLLRSGLTAHAEENGVEIIFDEVYPPAQTDFSTLMTQLKSADPDVVAQLGYTDDAAAIIGAMQDQDYYPNGAFFSGPPMGVVSEVTGDQGNYSYGLTFWSPSFNWSGPTFGTSQEYFDAFTAEYGAEPTYQSAIASGAGEILQQAITAAGSLDSAAVAEALHTGTFQTEGAGEVQYDETGRNLGSAVGIEQIQDGSVELIYAPGAEVSAAAIYPAPPWSER